MSLEDLFQFALNIEEAAINIGKDAESNPRNIKEHKTETSIPQKQGPSFLDSLVTQNLFGSSTHRPYF
jgi:hypothetical protein